MRIVALTAALLALPGCILVAGDRRDRHAPDEHIVIKAEAPDVERYRGADWPADARPPYSAMVVQGDVVYLAGTLGFTPGTRELPEGIAAQTANAFAAMESDLKRIGADLGDLTSCTCYLADIGDYADFNAAYTEALPDELPTRTTVGVAGLPLGAAVELSCTAALR